MTTGFLIDSAIPLYALGGVSPQREDCQQVLRLIAVGHIDGFASTEMIQETVFHRMRVTGNRAKAVREGRNLTKLINILDFNSRVLAEALALVETTNVRGRDAVHAATALVHGIDEIVSTDLAFDDIPGMKRIAPAAFRFWE